MPKEVLSSPSSEEEAIRFVTVLTIHASLATALSSKLTRNIGARLESPSKLKAFNELSALSVFSERNKLNALFPHQSERLTIS